MTSPRRGPRPSRKPRSRGAPGAPPRRSPAASGGEALRRQIAAIDHRIESLEAERELLRKALEALQGGPGGNP